MESFVSFQASLYRKIRTHVVGLMVLLVFVWVAGLPCNDCFPVSEHHHSASVTAGVGGRVDPQLDGKQLYRDDIAQIGGQLAAAAAAERGGRATHRPRREMRFTRRATRGGGGHARQASQVSNSTRAPPDVEVEALAAFKAAMTSDPSHALRSWIVGASAANESSDECNSWAGITCSPEIPYHIVGLDLSNLQLVGSLDSLLPTLGHLRFLQSLDLSVNDFEGSISGETLTNFTHLSSFNVSSNVVTGGMPSEMGELVNLRYLDLTQNNVSGIIPESLGNCSLLESIYLGSNQLEGVIPASLGALSGLQYLNLSVNSFSGSIPSSLGNCSLLRVLQLNANDRIEGALPQELSQLKQLEVLFLEQVYLSGAFPSWIVNLTSLAEFSMYGNSLSGEIPDTIGQLEFLWDFSVGEAPVSGGLPLSICNLTLLRYLQIEQTNISGPIPPRIGMLSNLYWLDLSNNLFSSLIPSSLANISGLVAFNLGLNVLMDPQPIPSWIESLTSLEHIVCSSMNLQGDLSSLAKLPNLQYLSIDENNLTGKIPIGFQNCTYLENFQVGQNQLTGVIPPELGVLRFITIFHVFENILTGPFPEFIANFTQLSTFDCQENYLSGLLDSSGKLGQLQEMTWFVVQSNFFEGPVPETFANCTSLSILYLDGNGFSGRIPASLGNMTNLNELSFESNNLEGPIPADFFKPGLQRTLLLLDFSRNNLEGNLPSEIGQLLQLQWLSLSKNKFTGIVPSSLGNCTRLANLDLSGNQFEGNIPAASILKMAASLVSLNLSDNLFSGSWPTEFSKLTAMQLLNVSSNNISGAIPPGLASCLNLISLDVSMNNLTGEIPQDLGLLKHLTFFNASFNNFLGPIPQAGIFNNSNLINQSSFLGNPGLCGPSSTIGLHHQECKVTPSTVSTHHRGCKGFDCKQVWIPVAVSSALILLGAMSIVIVAIKSGWRFKRGGKDDQLQRQVLLNFGAHTRFTEKDVLQTIDDPENVIGVGATSIVYKGVLPAGDVFALKKLLPQNNFGPSNNDATFDDVEHSVLVKEAKILAKLRHKNVLRCLSYYSNLDHNALIVEYMSEGSLHKNLHEVEPCRLMWQTVLKVAMGVAQGMKYLHHDLPQPLIHRDLKPSNIFLDTDFEPKVGDFGISKFAGAHREGEATASKFCGTVGYMPPEYSSQTWVSTKGDVYSYGMVIIELLTKRQPCSPNALEDQGTDLRNWVLNYFHESSSEFLDPSLLEECRLDNIAEEQLMYLLRVGLFCTRAEPQSRPSMINVVEMLTYIINLREEPVTRRTIEELANETDPTTWVTQDPANEGDEFGSNC